ETCDASRPVILVSDSFSWLNGVLDGKVLYTRIFSTSSVTSYLIGKTGATQCTY
ncbi:hypothetical protein FRC03_007027, partial [Tulasnella sp. 419]